MLAGASENNMCGCRTLRASTVVVIDTLCRTPGICDEVGFLHVVRQPHLANCMLSDDMGHTYGPQQLSKAGLISQG